MAVFALEKNYNFYFIGGKIKTSYFFAKFCVFFLNFESMTFFQEKI